MANVVTHPHLQVGFHPRPVGHSPTPVGFGFGLSAAPTVQAWPSPSHTQSFHWATPQQATPQAPLRVAKRRHEPEEGDRDDAMERSPTPERAKRAIPKRARTTPTLVTIGKDQLTNKENKPSASDENDVDVGFLLASLPPQSLLPLLTSLISAQPSLKPTILSLIPRPTLDAALSSLANSAQKLKDAYPYSNSVFSQSGSSWNTPGAFGGGRTGASSFSTGFGFGNRSSGNSSFGASPSSGGGMRDEYILSRIRPHIQDFVSACLSYLPYFSNITTSDASSPSSKPHATQSHATALRQQHKDKLHPTETYLFLAALTSHILAQPPLTQTELAPMLAPRLAEEWKAWVDNVDATVNVQGGMFGRETVQTWERGLDDFAQARGNQMEMMKEIRDRWVSKVGWLVGRQPMAMEES
ncbi:hypothetical protein C8Q70DRAFT_913694 [Cubamyces menziesii]|uniref:Tethering factor for nuclear proteasome STS1 n=1 Tax=Trametes cubensis TaxID=1111947 RepID=A0AAD7X6S6_9APHY|nr:hypothetical protein C8Q70DRAFT_913694 [Cubamyces menziesii]KAJ8472959.1 hypothetical protein ONZ51_g8154 [Trametes cubensis]